MNRVLSVVGTNFSDGTWRNLMIGFHIVNRVLSVAETNFSDGTWRNLIIDFHIINRVLSVAEVQKMGSPQKPRNTNPNPTVTLSAVEGLGTRISTSSDVTGFNTLPY
ncbi:hypothetical protein [Maribacter sp. 2307UL18-2]|uniref:hypothetical protein n=1 Tax=Maribacter sp. 2307UL18-2 TaxID=3386274 RepID=UPI0039BCA56C